MIYFVRGDISEPRPRSSSILQGIKAVAADNRLIFQSTPTVKIPLLCFYDENYMKTNLSMKLKSKSKDHAFETTL